MQLMNPVGRWVIYTTQRVDNCGPGDLVDNGERGGIPEENNIASLSALEIESKSIFHVRLL
jgi:hypothetical protein